MKKAAKNGILLLGALVAVAVVIVGGLLFFNLRVREHLSNAASETLGEVMVQQAYNFTSTMREELSIMNSIAELFPFGELSDERTIEKLNMLIDKTPLESMSVADVHGNALSSAGTKFNVSDREYFKRLLETKAAVVSEPIASRVITSHSVIVLAAPVIRNGEMVGAVLGAFDANRLNELFLSSFSGDGYAYIAANDGKIIAKTTNLYSLVKSDNLFEGLERADFYFGDTLQEIKQKILADLGGHSRYELDGHHRFVHYATIGVNKWNIFSIAPEESVLKSASSIEYVMSGITALFVIALGLLLLFIYMMQKSHIKELSHIAYVDEITGAPNFAKFKIEAQKLLLENPNTKYVVIKNDIDRFKLINQIFGFEEGNQILSNFARGMEAAIYSNKETFARAGSDEFVLLHEYISEEHLNEQKQKFRAAFAKLMGKDFPYKITFYSGRYYFKEGDKDISSAVEKANIAHKKCKESGVDFCIYSDDMVKDDLDEKEIENKMDAALRNREFKMFLQGKRYIADESFAGAEALVRWWVNGKVVSYPGSFIHVFEKNGFITKLDMFIFEEACVFIKNLVENNLPPITISVNFSRLHLFNDAFVSSLCAIADKHGVPRKYLEIELTETAFLDNKDLVLDVLNKLHEENFLLSMDDFGTGYSSLGLLKDIPVDVLKIDKGFFSDTDKSDRAKVVIQNMIKMAKELGIETVAEGVETKEHVDLLREFGCDIVQGYYYFKPIPSEEMAAMLKK